MCNNGNVKFNWRELYLVGVSHGCTCVVLICVVCVSWVHMCCIDMWCMCFMGACVILICGCVSQGCTCVILICGGCVLWVHTCCIDMWWVCYVLCGVKVIDLIFCACHVTTSLILEWKQTCSCSVWLSQYNKLLLFLYQSQHNSNL